MRLALNRRGTAGRRTARVQRRPSLISRTRMLAAAGLAAVSGAFYWTTVGREFVVDPSAVTIEGATYTNPGEIRMDLGLGTDASQAADGNGPAAARNLFRLRTEDIQRRIEALPAVRSVSVLATLPNRLAVVVRERVPIFIWRTGTGAWLSDREGVLFAAVDPAGDQRSAGLPSLEDLRATQTPVKVGSRLAAVDLEAARLLGAVTPADLGSTAGTLIVSVDDADGWSIAVAGGWRAVFGQYTPDLHTTDEIPLQVQCLGSLLSGRESTIATVVLAVAPDRCGTFTDASPSARPSR